MMQLLHKARGVGLALGLALATLLPAPPAAAAPGSGAYGRYHALIVGIAEYQYLPRLETAVNDASALHDLLSREYGYRSTLLLNPTRQQLIIAFDKLRAELTPEDNLLIFYAGHGYLDRATGEGYWLTVNAKADSQVEWLPVANVTWLLKATLARQALVIVDSCFSGTLTRDAPVVPAAGPARQAELDRLANKRSRKAMTSGGLEPVNDGGGDGHSVFTRALIENLREADKVVDGFQLFSRVRSDVVRNAQQTPQYADVRLAGDEGGEFLFVPVLVLRSGKGQTVALPSAGPDKEALFWQSIQDSTSASDYEAYLAQYPEGSFAPLARARAARYANTGAAATPAAAPSTDATENVFWASIQGSTHEADFQAYLAQYPEGQFAELARIRLRHLKQAAAVAAVPTKPEADPAKAEPAATPGRVATAKTEPAAPALQPLAGTYVVTANANLRAAPSVDAERVRTLPRGMEVEVAAQTADGDWLQLADDGAVMGYMHASLLQPRTSWQTEHNRRTMREEAEAEALRQAEREAAQRRTAAVVSPPPAPQMPQVGERALLKSYLETRAKDFLTKLYVYDNRYHITYREGTGGSSPIPVRIDRYEILAESHGRLKVRMTVDLSLSYSGSIGPMDATFVVLLERARVGEGVEFNIVGHE